MKLTEESQDLSDRFYLRDFQTYFIEKEKFQNFINELKLTIIDKILTTEIYRAIEKRIFYYYSCSLYNPPKEPCIDYIIRILFTELPPPYKYDFKLLSPNKKSMNDMIYAIRYSYGYSDRRSSGSYMLRKKVKHSNISVSSIKPGSVRYSKTMEDNSYESHSHKSLYKNRLNPISDCELPLNS